ncbi:MAG: hypothetical protein WDW36_009852 [Sanguina aurantia]
MGQEHKHRKPPSASFSKFFAQALLSTDTWTLPCECLFILIYSYVHFPLHVFHRAVLFLSMAVALIAPGYWVAVARHKLIAADRITTVLGNMIMILIWPTREVRDG